MLTGFELHIVKAMKWRNFERLFSTQLEETTFHRREVPRRIWMTSGPSGIGRRARQPSRSLPPPCLPAQPRLHPTLLHKFHTPSHQANEMDSRDAPFISSYTCCRMPIEYSILSLRTSPRKKKVRLRATAAAPALSSEL
jgi:hypothetical protein